jgi:sugar phosphate isomerase/epimerase
MSEKREGISRRTFLSGVAKGSLLVAGGLSIRNRAIGVERSRRSADGDAAAGSGTGKIRLGLVTYNLAKDWDVDTIIKRCEETGFEGVELRSTHAHKVEANLTAEERKAVKAKFDLSKVELVSLGTAFEYHSPDPKVLQKNMDGTEEYLRLAYDLGCQGIKVRPNGLPKEVAPEKTLRQIGESLRKCGGLAEKLGVEIWMEVHGSETSHVPHIRTILDVADHPFVKICWNCNSSDIVDGAIGQNFELIKHKVGSLHIHDLYDESYPYMELFGLLKKYKFDGYTFVEMSGSADPVRVMKYYRALWERMIAAA